MKIISIDPGVTGGIATFIDDTLIDTVPMPTYKIEVSPAVTVLAKDDSGKKVMIKSGPNKGTYKTKIKKAAKYKSTIDISELWKHLKDADMTIIEAQNPRPGNSAQASFTTGINFGKLLAVVAWSGSEMILVQPAVWKKNMHITMDKHEKAALSNDKAYITMTLKAKACSKAKKVFDREFMTKRGAMADGEAEAALIGHWYIENQKGKK